VRLIIDFTCQVSNFTAGASAAGVSREARLSQSTVRAAIGQRVENWRHHVTVTAPDVTVTVPAVRLGASNCDPFEAAPPDVTRAARIRSRHRMATRAAIAASCEVAPLSRRYADCRCASANGGRSCRYGYCVFLRHFGTNTPWYLHSQLVWLSVSVADWQCSRLADGSQKMRRNLRLISNLFRTSGDTTYFDGSGGHRHGACRRRGGRLESRRTRPEQFVATKTDGLEVSPSPRCM
jgi:hypothetical protein